MTSAVFWIRISLNADPDPGFYLNPDPDSGFLILTQGLFHQKTEINGKFRIFSPIFLHFIRILIDNTEELIQNLYMLKSFKIW